MCFIRFYFRRHYIKKCEQFFKLKTDQDVEQVGFVLSTPSTAAIVIILHLFNHCVIFFSTLMIMKYRNDFIQPSC